MPKSTLWKEQVLKVYFFEPEQDKFTYKGAKLHSWRVMQIVREGWNFTKIENGECVPTFEQVSDARDAHIRVLFKSKFV